jgi:hypothetical protein
MYKTLMLALVLLFSAAWLQAQQSYPQPDASQASGTTSGQTMSGQTTVEGCLQDSNGNYTLTDKSGAMYQLTGDTSKLSDHVGHKVQITGTTAGSGSASSASGAGSPGSQQAILEVKSMKHISKTCKSAAK